LKRINEIDTPLAPSAPQEHQDEYSSSVSQESFIRVISAMETQSNAIAAMNCADHNGVTVADVASTMHCQWKRAILAEMMAKTRTKPSHRDKEDEQPHGNLAQPDEQNRKKRKREDAI
jgi:hypothetical protein